MGVSGGGGSSVVALLTHGKKESRLIGRVSFKISYSGVGVGVGVG